jgi:hypothetical protein
VRVLTDHVPVLCAEGALISQEGITRRLLASIAPQASFHVYNIDKCVKETS